MQSLPAEYVTHLLLVGILLALIALWFQGRELGRFGGGMPGAKLVSSVLSGFALGIVVSSIIIVIGGW